MNARQANARRAGAGRALLHVTIITLVATASVLGNTRFHSPPRFDGAGYAVLAQAILSGQGYREIDHPERPPHAHYPPGYPVALAALWSLTGPSVVAAHALSVVCTVLAVLAAWCWLRRLYAPRLALLLGLALAVNWTWVRAGGAIQSEPLYLALAQLTILAVGWASRQASPARCFALGALLGVCILTRHVGVALALAVGIELIVRRQTLLALATGLSAAVFVTPWLVWLALVRNNTQLALLARPGWPERLAGNALFYVRRLPDVLTGPFVEVGTVFRGSTWLSALMTAWAVLVTACVAWGAGRAIMSPRRRLAALVLITGLALLWVWPFTEAGRFLIPLVPFLLVAAVEGVGRLLARVGVRKPRTWSAAALLVAAIPYSASAIVTDRAGARERSQAGFDAACAWIAQHGDRPGPILTRQPGEAFWLTQRQALAPPGDEPAVIDRAITRYRVAYLLIDDERYVRAPSNPLQRFVESRPERVERVWPNDAAASARGPRFTVYAVGHGRPAGPVKTIPHETGAPSGP